MEINKVFDLLASRMNVDFERSKQLSPELRKITRESIVSTFLKSTLPKHLSIGSGQVISTGGEVEGEVDIVIYDTLQCPIFPLTEDVQVFPIEGVYALVEVEAKLGRKELDKHINKFKVAKSLPKTAYYEQKGDVTHHFKLYGKELEYFPTLGIIFAFDSINLEDLKEQLNGEYIKRGLNIEQQIDWICVFKKGMIIHRDPKDGKIGFPPSPGSQLICTKGTPGQNLLSFYIYLMGILPQAWTRPIKLLEYGKSAIYGRFK